jgi:5-hydroxyisourate hydrolase
MGEMLLTRRNIIATGMAGGAVALSPLAMAQAPSSPPAGVATGPVLQMGLSPRLTMHAIDTFHGTPGAGMKCQLSILESGQYRQIKSVTTTENGRTAEPLLAKAALKPGRYELLLYFEEYFQKRNVKLPAPNFLGVVPVRFVIKDVTQRYHLPVLFSPWGYSYYRGS